MEEGLNFKVNLGTPPPKKEEAETRKGTVSACFLPADNYVFKSTGKLNRVVVPRAGEFPEGVDMPFAGQSFNVSPGNGQLLFGDLLKIMFATGAYPDLEKNQRFVLYSIEVTPEAVVLVGETITLEEGV